MTIRRRLYEEYNHKEKVMKLYSGLSNSNFGLGNNEKEKLIKIVLKTIEENPSEILGKGETLMDKILDKIKEIRIKAYLNQIKADNDSEKDDK